MRPCDVHHSGRGARRTADMLSVQGSTKGMATQWTRVQAAPTFDADDAPKSSQSRARMIPQHHKLTRNFRRRPLRNDTAVLAQRTDTLHVQCTLRSHLVHLGRLQNDSQTQRTVPGSKHNEPASTTTPIFSVTSSTSAIFDAAVTPAVLSAAVRNREQMAERLDTRRRVMMTAALELCRQGDSLTSVWSDSDQMRQTLHFPQRYQFERSGHTHRCGLERHH